MDPSLNGIPLGVVQYNPYGNLGDLPVEANRRMDHSNGSLIAVSYEVGACTVIPGPNPRKHSTNTTTGARPRLYPHHARRPGPRRLPRDRARAGGSEAQEGGPDAVPHRRSVRVHRKGHVLFRLLVHQHAHPHPHHTTPRQAPRSSRSSRAPPRRSAHPSTKPTWTYRSRRGPSWPRAGSGPSSSSACAGRRSSRGWRGKGCGQQHPQRWRRRQPRAMAVGMTTEVAVLLLLKLAPLRRRRLRWRC